MGRSGDGTAPFHFHPGIPAHRSDSGYHRTMTTHEPQAARESDAEHAARLRRARARHRAGLYASVSVSLLIAAAVGLTAFSGFARASFEVGPARVSVMAAPSLSPGTTAAVPPFGSVQARTHAAPLALRLSLDEVDLPLLERFAVTGSLDDETLDGFVGDIRSGSVLAMLKGLFAAALAAGFVGWSLRHRWRMVVSSALVGALVPAALVGWAYVQFDAGSFRTPQFRGALSYAPSLIGLAQRRIKSVESLQEQVAKLAADLARYYDAPQSFASGGPLSGTYRVLHVTDIHLDPVGLELADSLAKEFRASLIIDTGDINHYGSEAEAQVLASRLPTDVPRVFVAGNHDSPQVIAALRRISGVTVLVDELLTIDGLTVFGVPDPASSSDAVEPDAKAMRSAAEGAASALEAAIASGEPTPTIVAIHNPAMRGPFRGLAPLLLAGHTHTPALERDRGAWYLNSGTTGGIHFSRMRSDPHIPHSASILYYTSDEPRRLIAIDRIEAFGIEGQSSLSRTLIDESLLP